MLLKRNSIPGGHVNRPRHSLHSWQITKEFFDELAVVYGAISHSFKFKVPMYTKNASHEIQRRYRDAVRAIVAGFQPMYICDTRDNRTNDRPDPLSQQTGHSG